MGVLPRARLVLLFYFRPQYRNRGRNGEVPGYWLRVLSELCASLIGLCGLRLAIHRDFEEKRLCCLKESHYGHGKLSYWNLLSGVNLWVIVLNHLHKVTRTERGNWRGGATKVRALFTHFLTQKYTPLSIGGSLPSHPDRKSGPLQEPIYEKTRWLAKRIAGT